MATFCERERVPATSCEALTTSSRSVTWPRYGTATTPLRSATSETMSPMIRLTSKSFGV